MGLGGVWGWKLIDLNDPQGSKESKYFRLNNMQVNQVVNHPREDVSCSIRGWRARTGWDTAGGQVGSEAESQLVCLKGQEWRSTASWNAVCSRVGVYTGGVESPQIRLVAYRRAEAGDTQLEGPLLSPHLRGHHDQSGLQQDNNTQICHHT